MSSYRITLIIALGLALGVTSAQADLVHHYTFDNEDAEDQVGDHDGTIEGSDVTFVTGVTGLPSDRAVYLNEEGFGNGDDNVSFEPLEFGPQFSITAWLQPVDEGTDTQNHSIMTIAANTRGGFAGPDGFKWFVNNWNSDPVDGRMILESHDGVTGMNAGSPAGTLVQDEEWHHVAITFDTDVLEVNMYHQGENVYMGNFLEFTDDQPWRIGAFEPPNGDGGGSWIGAIDEVAVFNTVLTEDEVVDIFENGLGAPGGAPALLAGDANQDLSFDQLDLVQVQITAKYLSGQPATWGEGDWNGAPGGSQGSPPPGNGLFDQLDIIAALNSGVYLTGPYGAVSAGGITGDGQTSVGYDVGTGEVWVDAPAGTELTSINIDSAAGIFTADAAQNLGGSFDNDTDGNIFKATFGGSFGSLSFGNVARTGLTEASLQADLTVVGSLAGGGELGEVDLIYVPEPSTVIITALGLSGVLAIARRRIRVSKPEPALPR